MTITPSGQSYRRLAYDHRHRAYDRQAINRQIFVKCARRAEKGFQPLVNHPIKDSRACPVLLASNKAGSFITGANFVVDGGFNAMTI
jgi:hypothetical protein